MLSRTFTHTFFLQNMVRGNAFQFLFSSFLVLLLLLIPGAIRELFFFLCQECVCVCVVKIQVLCRFFLLLNSVILQFLFLMNLFFSNVDAALISIFFSHYYSASKSHYDHQQEERRLDRGLCRNVLLVFLFKFNFLISYALGNAFVFAAGVMRGFVFLFLCLLDKGIQNWRNIQSTDQINLKQSLFFYSTYFFLMIMDVTLRLLNYFHFVLLSSLVHAMCRVFYLVFFCFSKKYPFH